MRKTTCECCNNEAPLNSVIKIDDKLYCDSCIKSTFAEDEDLKGRVTPMDLDPTVCSYCEVDFDDKELPKLSKYPICDPCHKNLQKKILPVWVKAFFAGVLLLVVFSFYWNWRFYQGYRDLNEANTFAATQDYAKATKLMHESSAEVPEVGDLKTLETYYKGLDFLTKDKSADAYKAFMSCKPQVPPDFNIDFLIYSAKRGMCYDAKDYKGFLENSEKIYAIDSTQISSLISMASAYSCLYVAEGNDANKIKAEGYIKRAKAIDNTTADTKAYYNMLDYRMTMHQIVDLKQFVKQFPNGWTKS